jgi:class 3 adenylate cyclase/tetratricopeptide (TPR) repeat protein
MTDAAHGRELERRHLTILFADLGHYGALAASVDSEVSYRLLKDLKAVCARVITRHGGFVHSSKGDGVMGVFGYPHPTELAGRSAVEAALELRDAVRDMPLPWAAGRSGPLQLHSGVHAGLVTYEADDISTLGGQAPNVAARLSDVAVDDEILVSADTLGGDFPLFDVIDRGLQQMKGEPQPLHVLQVLGRSRASTRYEARTQRGLTPFVGRSAELATIAHGLEAAMAGAHVATMLVGPAGVGKTRIAERFLEDARRYPLRICRSYCENYLGAEALQPFLQMLRQLDGDDVVRADAGLADVVTQALTVAGNPRQKGLPPDSAAAAATACLQVFASLAARQPLLLFIDDWQWADVATRQVMTALRQSGVASTYVLMASRELPADGQLDAGTHLVTMPPFADREAADAILMLRPDANPFEVQQVRQRSGGNPLYIEELCHWTLPERIGAKDDRGDALPAWLSTLIESRLGRLSPALAETVRAAAVIGVLVPVWLLEQVIERPLEDGATELARHDWLFPGEHADTLRFKHGITRDVVYASVPLFERESLHRRAARALRERHESAPEETLPELLSYHYRAGAQPEEAVRFAALAGDRASAAGAPDRARSQYLAALAALDLLESPSVHYGTWQSILYKLGLACAFDPAPSHVAVFARAVARAREQNSPDGLTLAEYWLGFVHYALGDHVTALGHFEAAVAACVQALEAARAGGAEERLIQLAAHRVQLIAAIGQARAASGEFELAFPLLDEAIAVKRQHRRSSSPAVASAYALSCKGAVLGELGRYPDAYACFAEALDALGAGHSPVEASILAWQAMVLAFQGRWDEARDTADRVQALAQRAGSLYVLAQGQAIAAYADWAAGLAGDALDRLVRATSWLERHDKRLSISVNYGWLAEAMAQDGRLEQSRLYADRALERARVSDPFGAAAAYRAAARLCWREAALPDAELARALEHARARKSLREEALTLLAQGRLAADRRDVSASVVSLAAARAAFLAMGMTWHARMAEQTDDSGALSGV